MRHLRLLLIVGLVLAVSAPAWALSLSGWIPGTPISIHFNSLDVGAQYKYGTFLGNDPLNPLSVNNNTIAQPWGGMPGTEDAWGIARVSNITDENNTVVYWSAATASTELTALFFGVVDQSIKNTQLAANIDQQVSFSSGFKFMMFEDAAKNYNPNGGPLARTGVMAYPTVTDGTLILEAKGVAGLFDSLQSTFLNPVYADHSASADLIWNATRTALVQVQNGSGHAYADIYDLNADGILTGLDLAGGGKMATANPLVNADIKLDWTLTPPGTPIVTPWWDLADQDPVRMYPVPEPVTMAGMLLGIGCLSRYIRKRR